MNTLLHAQFLTELKFYNLMIINLFECLLTIFKVTNNNNISKVIK